MRMADTDMDGLKPMGTALTQIKESALERHASSAAWATSMPARRSGLLDKDALDRLRDLVENFKPMSANSIQRPPLVVAQPAEGCESGDEVHLTANRSSSTSKTTSPAYVASKPTVAFGMRAVTRCEGNVAGATADEV